jgi:hypothetical protein
LLDGAYPTVWLATSVFRSLNGHPNISFHCFFPIVIFVCNADRQRTGSAPKKRAVNGILDVVLCGVIGGA